jgi:hypothetical protein
MVTAHSAIPFRLLCGFGSAATGEFFSFDIPVLSRFYLDHWKASGQETDVRLQYVLRSEGRFRAAPESGANRRQWTASR